MMRLFLFSVFLFISAPTLAAFEAQVNRSTVYDGDSFQLTLSLDQQTVIHPDTSSLDQDFEVLGMASGSSINIINGEKTARTTWTITLRPKSLGLLTIPPLSINGEATHPLTIRVVEPPAGGAKAERDVFVETEVSSEAPYVQEMLVYTVKIYFAVDLTEGSLSDPALDNVVIERLGKDSASRENRNGRSYQVVTRRYALFPQASGKLELPAPILNGKIPDSRAQNTPRSPFDNDPFFGNSPFGSYFVNTRPIRVRGDKKEVNVLPPPSQARSEYWLPTPQLLLTESWDIPDKITVGAPITRTITLRAKNLTASQLPKIESSEISTASVYADKASQHTSNVPDGVDGFLEQRIVYVPNAVGDLEIPAISIPWWDTNTKTPQTAALPAKVFSVNAIPGTTSSESAKSPELKSVAPQPDARPAPINQRQVPASSSIWPWASAGLTLLWLGTLLLWQLDRRQNRDFPTVGIQHKNIPASSMNQLRKKFVDACMLNNPADARKALISWAEKYWPQQPPAGITDLAKRLNNPSISVLLNELDAAVYAGHGSNWQGKALCEALKALPKDTATRAKTGGQLPELFSSSG